MCSRPAAACWRLWPWRCCRSSTCSRSRPCGTPRSWPWCVWCFSLSRCASGSRRRRPSSARALQLPASRSLALLSASSVRSPSPRPLSVAPSTTLRSRPS
eukprot:Amastigsp_a178328_10.p4 type:complete len:100 gc:universal Amastigsp_a178328_10:863-1162(+)